MVAILSDQYFVPFTQYLRPNGRKRPMTISVTGGTATKARVLVKEGYRFEVEELTTGEASMTVASPLEGYDIAIEVVPNGPEVLEAVGRLVQSAWAKHG